MWLTPDTEVIGHDKSWVPQVTGPWLICRSWLLPLVGGGGGVEGGVDCRGHLEIQNDIYYKNVVNTAFCCYQDSSVIFLIMPCFYFC